MEQNHNKLFDKTDKELIAVLARYWKMSEEELMKPFKVIATFKKSNNKDKNGKEFGFFEDVRNLNGDILYYPYGLGVVKIFSMYKEGFLSSDIWQINVKFASRSLREKYQNPFMLEMDNAIVGKPKIQFLDRIEKERLIRKKFEETGYTEYDAEFAVNTLKRLMGDLYSDPEHFVFELLQNADDQPIKNKYVNVKLKALNESLLFLHTGKPFTKEDVISISGSGSTKANAPETIGYKGIGFKSVFSDAETVYIDSGNFSFAFDKYSPIYSKKNIDKIPWQIKPIWQERYRLPTEIQREDSFFSSSVGIALHVGGDKINIYNQLIPNLLSEHRFVLFLRNIREIVYENLYGDLRKITKEYNNGSIQIIENDVVENWIVKDFIIDIPQETKEAIQNEKLVPEKLKEATKTKITFAAKLSDEYIIPVNDAVIFNYLPTKEKGFGFNFLVNADFLTVANREAIHQKNIWNRFLFENIGTLLVDWVRSLSDYSGAIALLPQKKYDGDNLLYLDFYSSFNKAISESSFIKGHKGTILSQQEIMIDKSELSKIIGKDLFCQIVAPSKSLPFNDEDEKALKDSELCQDMTKITPLPVLDKLYNNSLFNNWFAESDEATKRNFYDWLIQKNSDKRKDSIVKVVNDLPIYKFGDKYVSKKEATNSLNKIVIRKAIRTLVPVFESCGIECSENIDELPISQFYDDGIVEVTFDYVFNRLINNTEFSKWLHNAPDSDVKILTDWLDKQYEHPETRSALSDFVESIPIIEFKDKYCSKIEIGDNMLVITNKLSPIVDILEKIGFSCSKNIENSPFAKYLRLPEELDLFNRIKDKAKEALYNNKNILIPTEKLSLFQTLARLDGVKEDILSQNLLFRNQADTHRRWLSTMASFSSDIPTWMYEYTICEAENFPELQPYLVKKERIFEDIIKKKIDDLLTVVTLKEIDLEYSLPPLFTEYLIDTKGISMSVLELIEQKEVRSKKHFLQKVDKIILDVTHTYSPEELEYRIIALAFEVYNDEELRTFTKKIYVGERAISSYTISDSITLEYHEGKRLILPLDKLLTSYSESDMVSQIKGCLSNFQDTQLNCLLALKPMNISDVWKQIDRSQGHTPYSYLLGIFYTRKILKYYNDYVTYVELSQESSTWVHQLLDIMYEQKVELFNDSFGYRLTNYFAGYFNNDYVNPDEKILDSIESWADSDDKRKYLVSLGVKTEQTRLIKFRKSLVNNEKIDDADIENQKAEITSTINYLKSKNLLPLTGDNQIDTLLKIQPFNKKYLFKQIDIGLLKECSYEYDLDEYKQWKKDDTIKIYLCSRRIPNKLVKTNDDNLLLCKFDEGDYYYSSSRILYIYKECVIQDVLYNVISDNSIPFKSTDWQQLFYDNLVSIKEIEKKDAEIENLKKKLQKYIDEYEALSNKAEKGSDETTSAKTLDSDTTESSQDILKMPENEGNGNNGDSNIKITGETNQSLSKAQQYEAQIEAQKRLIQEHQNWTFPNGYGEWDEDGKPCHFSTVKVIDENKCEISIVLKSYKNKKEPFKINPEEWDWVKNGAWLYIYDGKSVVRHEKEDLIRNQSHVSITFSTENLNIEDRITAFSETLHYFKELHFEFNSFNVSDIRNMSNTKNGVQDIIPDEDGL